ncbi:MAG TPA: acetate--CoA ligase family protein [Methanomassiliicoccales archaeon]|nr:acetate--CoA ligase family protein [Methanomassiliicoccales archaeon]
MDLDSIARSGRKTLSEAEAKTLLREHGVKTTAFVIPEREELQSLNIEFPVAVKVCSPDVMHKSDKGGVFLDVRNRDELRLRYDEILGRFPGSKVLVEPMARKGFEAIVGLVRDKGFGLCILFGSGGVLANLIQDASFRKLPVTAEDAAEMISETKAKAVFEGFRDLKADLSSTTRMLLAVSEMGTRLGDKIDQMDLNPVILRADGYEVVDAKVILL